jgi:arylsulfatase A-like enzyme
MRVPFIARWPGRIPAAVTTSAFGTTMDLFPTCARLAGATPPTDRIYDGDDLAPVLLGNSAGREPVFFYYSNLDDDQELKAVRKGRWKLHTSIGSFRKTPLLPNESGPPLLFDLNEDPSEQRNLAGTKPEIAKELRVVMEEHKTSVRPGPQQL